MIDVINGRLIVRRIFGTDFKDLQSITGAPFHKE